MRPAAAPTPRRRLIATELETTKGWKIIPQNVTGKGGGVMARKLKSQPNDGLTFGIAVTQTFTYNVLAVKNAGYAADEFTYVTTTAGTQIGLVAKSEHGWKSIEDVVAAAKAGTAFKLGAMGPKLADIAYVTEQKFGIKFNTVMLLAEGRFSTRSPRATWISAGWRASRTRA